MNYLNANPNSQSIDNKNNLGTSTQILHLTGNRKRIFLPAPLFDVIGMRVKSLSFATTPTNYSNSQILVLSCDDLIETTMNQSYIILADPNDPSGSSQIAIAKSIVATWVAQEPAFPPLPIPNYNLPNYEQPIVWFKKPMRFTSFNFILDTDLVQLDFDATNRVILILEFFYFSQTK